MAHGKEIPESEEAELEIVKNTCFKKKKCLPRFGSGKTVHWSVSIDHK